LLPTIPELPYIGKFPHYKGLLEQLDYTACMVHVSN